MVYMNRESYIGMGVAVAIFLLVLPLVINNGLSHQYVSNSSLDKFNNYTGVTLSYYAAIFGGFVGGVFTYAGVKLSLDNQSYLRKQEAETHKNLLLLQLKYSYNAICELDPITIHIFLLPPVTVYDKAWYTHLPYIPCLEQADLESIVGWFSSLKELENMARISENGQLFIEQIKECTSEYKQLIKPIIDKIESDHS